MSDPTEPLREKLDELSQQVETLQTSLQRGAGRSIRMRSDRRILGMPFYDVALGPDPIKQQLFGHARGFIAIGDVASGVFAMGGAAWGLFSFGGISIGLVAAFGGVAFGSLAIGGTAIGGVAVGGAAVGYVALGGAAFGHYAAGGAAAGEHVISATERSPEAIRFFRQFIPFVK